MKPVCYVCVGLPGSGKSTWANKSGFRVVSTNAIRGELFFGDQSCQEDPPLVLRTAFKQLREQLNQGNSVIFDATNISAKSRKEVLKNIYPFPACAVVFTCGVDECIKRMKKRQRSVPSKVIKSMNRRFSIPTIEEGFQEIMYVS